MRKGFALPLIIVVVISVVLGAFIFFKQSKFNGNTQTQNIPNPSVDTSYRDKYVQLLHQSPSPSPSYPVITPSNQTGSTNQEKCIASTNDKILLERGNKKILLKDMLHYFELDVTTLPDIKIGADGLSCANLGYDLDMYKMKTSPVGSTARFSVSSPIHNDSGLNLVDYAKQKLNYFQGKHILKDSNYGNPFTSTPLITSNLANSMTLVAWEDIYTEQDTSREGTTASKHYLLGKDNKIYVFTVYAWDIPNFNRAAEDFDKVVLTFQLIN